MQPDGTWIAFRLGKLEEQVEEIKRAMATRKRWEGKALALVALMVYASLTNLKSAEMGDLLAALIKGLK